MSYLEERRKMKQSPESPKEKKVRKPIAKKSAKKIEQERSEKEVLAGEDSFLVKWHKARQKQLIGKCRRCGHEYNQKIFSNAVKVNAHVLPKREGQYPSVALHQLNHIELTPFCGCHNWYDEYASWEEKLTDPVIGEYVESVIILLEPYLSRNDKIQLEKDMPTWLIYKIHDNEK